MGLQGLFILERWAACNNTRLACQAQCYIDVRTDEHGGIGRTMEHLQTRCWNTKLFGSKTHNYPEEIYIISGRLYDEAFGVWLEAGDYASRPPGEIHGPFICEQECLVMEVSFPSQVQDAI